MQRRTEATPRAQRNARRECVLETDLCLRFLFFFFLREADLDRETDPVRLDLQGDDSIVTKKNESNLSMENSMKT